MSLLLQLYTDDVYIYAIHENELDIFDNTEATTPYASINEYSFIYTSITGNSSAVYIGTTNNGVKRILKECVYLVSPAVISGCLTDYLTSPYIEGDYINYLHANGDYLAIISSSGTKVEVLDISGGLAHGRTTISGGYTAEKCFITTSGVLYYAVGSGQLWSVDVQTNALSDWTSPSYRYINGAGKLPDGEKNTDIFVTEGTGTAVSGINNTLFVATTSGAFIIDEYSGTVGAFY